VDVQYDKIMKILRRTDEAELKEPTSRWVLRVKFLRCTYS
jgi:hypothetical protein